MSTLRAGCAHEPAGDARCGNGGRAWRWQEEKCFDQDVMADLTRQIIEHAYADGNCVVVGRGAQCILQSKADVFHVFVYAPFRVRVHRLRTRLEPGADIERRIHAVDGERAHYLRLRFGKEWNYPHLYDLMISSGEDEEADGAGDRVRDDGAGIAGCAAPFAPDGKRTILAEWGSRKSAFPARGRVLAFFDFGRLGSLSR